jgi:hypothetical protein
LNGIAEIRKANCVVIYLLLSFFSAAALGVEGLSVESAGIAPQGSAIQNGSLILRCLLKNSSQTSQEGFLVARISGDFASEDRFYVRVEPQRMKTIEFPVRIPQSNTEPQLEVEVSMVAMRDGREVLLMDGDQPALHRITARRMIKRSVVTALAMGAEPVAGPDWRWERTPVFATLECAFASRIDAELPNDCIDFEAKPLPIHLSDWQSIDNLIIAEPRFIRDSASLGAVRTFLAEGGRVWVMLDAINVDLVKPLLESNQSIDSVDTIDLMRYRIDVSKVPISEADRTAEFDSPIPFKRIRHHGGTVTHSMDGWPVALVMPVGRGELLLTMLNCEGMIQSRSIQASPDPLYQSSYELRRWAKNLGEIVHEARTAPLLKMSELTYPVERIGNPVVSRSLVFWTLFTFCGALTAMGLWRALVGEIPKLGLLYPLVAFLASVPILLGGFLQKKDIPRTVSQFQWVQFHNAAGGTLRESNAVYLSESAEMQLLSSSDGFATPDSRNQSGITTAVRDDFERWRLTNVAWPAGIWRYTTESTLPDKSMIVAGKWTSEGLEVHVPDGLPSTLNDPLMSFLAGAPVLGKKKDDKTVLFDGEFAAEGERWTLQSLVDDEQRRRSEIYRNLFSGSDRLRVLARTMVGWTDLFPEGPTWNSESLERRGAALVSFPIVLPQGVAGDEILVPFPFISLRNSSDSNSTPIFMDSVGRWVDQSSNASSTQIDLVLPAEVVPLKASSVQFHWDVEAPRREVRLSLIHPSRSEPIELVSLDAPSLPWVSSLEEPLLLDAAGSGKIVLKIEVSNDRESGGSLPWRIRHLRMSVRGTVLPAYRWNASQTTPSPTP